MERQCEINDDIIRKLILKVDPRIADALVQHPHRIVCWFRSLGWVLLLAFIRARGVRIVWTVHNLQPHECYHPSIAMRTIGSVRRNRYSTLRSVFRRDDALAIDADHAFREELKSVVIPPGAWAAGRTLDEVRARGAEVAFTGVRRQGILGREPATSMMLREGDIVVMYGMPEALEHAEAVLLAG